MSNSNSKISSIDSRSRGAITRQALIEAALEIFGRDGYEAASTRSIADKAGANQALINYHFKGKEGLYLAVFEYIAEQMNNGMGSIADEILLVLDAPSALSIEEQQSFALASLQKIISRLVHMMNSNLTKHWSTNILREQQSPTAAFEIMNAGPMGKLFILCTRLVAMAKNIQPDSDQARMLSLLIFGQVHVLRACRATLLSHMQWEKFGEEQMQFAEKLIYSNLHAILQTDQKQ